MGIRSTFIINAVFIFLYVSSLIISFSTLQHYNRALQPTDAIEAQMKPLAVVKFCAYEVALMLSIALRALCTSNRYCDEAQKYERATSFKWG